MKYSIVSNEGYDEIIENARTIGGEENFARFQNQHSNNIHSNYKNVDDAPQNWQDLFGVSDEDVKKIQNSLRKNSEENGTVKISTVCDSTLLFLFELEATLRIAGCKNIKITSRPATEDEIPKNKPFCNWYYAAEGILPDV